MTKLLRPETVARELHRQLLALARQPLGAAELLFRARQLLSRYEPLLARSLKNSLLLAWLKAARKLAGQVQASVPPPRVPVFAVSGLFPPEPDGVRLPQIERAVALLLRKQLLMPDDFRRIDQDARRSAFTVARVQTTAALQRIRTALAEDIAQGGTLRQFGKRVAEDLDPVFAPHQVESLYRTQIMQAYGAGQREILTHPLVADEFPYVLWTAIHDSRTRPDHLAMEKHGPGGIAVYRRDDPIWQTLWPPAAWNCRCHAIPLSLEDAARHGAREARRWLRTGVPPRNPEFAATPYPITPPPGWPTQGRIAAAV